MTAAAIDSGRRSADAMAWPPIVVGAAFAWAMVLGACTGSSESSSPAAYTQPAWMVQAAQENELRGEAMVECLATAGIQVTAEPGGGVSGKLPEVAPEHAKAQSEAMEAQSKTCRQRVQARLGFATQLSDAQQYVQMTDTLECLRAQGRTELGDPPSEAAWVDAFNSGDDLWSPYGQLYKANPDITETEWNALKEVCAEGGVLFDITFGDGTP